MVEEIAPENDVPSEAQAPSEVEEAILDAQATLNEVKEAVAVAAEPGVGDGAPDESPGAAAASPGVIDLLGDVDMQVKIELGRTQMLVEDVLRLGQGSVVELDKLAGDPVDVYANQRLVARGEVLVLNDNFCVRISEIVADLEQHATDVVRDEGTVV